MKNLLLLWFNVLLFVNVQGQGILYGPVIGGVTDSSAKIFIRTSGLDSIRVELFTDTAQGTIATFTSLASPQLDTSSTLVLKPLLSVTRYFYKIYVNDTQQGGWNSFQTFPSATSNNDFSFGFGSCIRHPDEDSVFLEASKHDLSFFLILGDWGYHDQQSHFPSQTDFFCVDYQDVVKTYHGKYGGPRLSRLLRNLPFDYVYDNHDYMWTYSTRDSTTFVDSQNKEFTEYPNPPGCRANSIRGYYNLFPHYPLVDTTDGIYHSFRYGNTEIFMVDNRECRSPLSHAFVKDNSGNWTFNPPADYRMLGQKQFNWLIDGLKNSTATWKFIVTGVPFNKKYGDFMNTALTLQNLTIPGIGNGFDAAAGIALSSWAGFPHDQDSLLMIVQQYGIKNVIVLSGDSHTSAIDDGQYAGLPELMAGNLGKENSQVAYLAHSFGIDLWNSGGQGLGNSNFNEAFGKVEVHGNDSVVLNIVDLYGQLVASKTIINGNQNTGLFDSKSTGPPVIAYPNPAGDYCRMVLNTDIQRLRVSILSIEGYTIKTEFFPSAERSYRIDLSDISAGTYLLESDFQGGRVVIPLIIIK